METVKGLPTGNVLEAECYFGHHVVTDYTRQNVAVRILSNFIWSS